MTSQKTIPCLRPFFETAVYDEKGRCILPSSLAWECGLYYALDHDFSVLKYTKRLIRNHGFGFEGGTFHNAYRKVKEEQSFSHEMIHAWLDIWGTTDSYVPMLYTPHYNGNSQAESLVTAMQEMVIDGFKYSKYPELDSLKYFLMVDNEARNYQISTGQKYRNDAIAMIMMSGRSIDVYDWLRANKIPEKGMDIPSPKTRLGEEPVSPHDGNTLSIPRNAIENFFNACQPIIESLVLTINDLHAKIGGGNKPLKPRTIDMMFRTLKMREFHNMMHSGKAKVMSVSHLKWLEKIENNNLLDDYDAKIKTQYKTPVYAP